MGLKIHPSLNDESNMERNWVQFPRLLTTIILTQKLDVPAIAVHMDLPLSKVYALFHRAGQVNEDNIERSK